MTLNGSEIGLALYHPKFHVLYPAPPADFRNTMNRRFPSILEGKKNLQVQTGA